MACVSELGAGAGDQLRSAPATSGAFAELQIKRNRGKSWIELAKMVSSAPAELFLIFLNVAVVAYTCTGFLIVCDFRYSASG